jgi:uncharacterized membrane protein HdeD (DUF308 family)
MEAPMTSPSPDLIPTPDRRTSLVAAGVFLAAFGALTILLVLLSVMRPAMLVGLLILGAAAVQLVQALRATELWPRVWHWALCAVYAIGALLLLIRPDVGGAGLWVLLSAFFLVDGGVRLTLGYRSASPRLALWLVSSGVASVAIALLIYFGLPSSGGWQLGLLLGVALFVAGGFLLWAAQGPTPAVVEPPPTALPANDPAPEAYPRTPDSDPI